MMSPEQIRSFVLQYLEAYQCDILEKAPTHVTVKLSIEADKELTNRAYYWGFVERTGAPAETMTMTFVFDPASYHALKQTKPFSSSPAAPGGGTPAPAGAAQSGAPALAAGPGSGAAAPAAGPGSGSSDSILGRYFGFVPTQVTTRVPTDDVTFGSRRMLQLFQSAKVRGRFVRLFEEPQEGGAAGGAAARAFGLRAPVAATVTYETWLLVNFRVELVCDMKRSEIHSLAISLATGRIRENVYEELSQLKLSPRLPADIRLLPDVIPLTEAASRLEDHLERKVRGYNHKWAVHANERLVDELARIDGYYHSLLEAIEPDNRSEVAAQYENRKQEIDWQYRPRVEVAVINCGFFHLKQDTWP